MNTYQQCKTFSSQMLQMYKQHKLLQHTTELFINISNRMTIEYGLLMTNSNVLYCLLSQFSTKTKQ